jgi:hypothetical protein
VDRSDAIVSEIIWTIMEMAVLGLSGAAFLRIAGMPL